MWWLLQVAGCIYVQETKYVDGSGDSGVTTTEGTPERCVSDDECPGHFACSGAVSASTDARGCVERCASDWDCKAGSLCSDDGACR